MINGANMLSIGPCLSSFYVKVMGTKIMRYAPSSKVIKSYLERNL